MSVSARPVGEEAGEVDRIYRRAAEGVGLPFVALTEDIRPPSAARLTPALAMGLSAVRFDQAGGPPVMIVAPRRDELDRTVARLAADRSGTRIAITTPRRLRASLVASVAATTIARARRRLAVSDPDLSAARVPSRLARLVVAVVLPATAVGVLLGWHPVSLAVCLASGFLFHLTAGLRLMMLVALKDTMPHAPPDLPAGRYPHYSVLVCLYREEAMVAGLAAALAALDWPRDRLEIIILTEADDPATAAAARAAFPHERDTVLVVPPGEPRTKPRALAYGFAFARGDIVTVFDAEDRPDPGQLRAAAATLLAGPPQLACVQAELRIDGDRTLLQKLFAIDYACQFNAVLPWYAAGDAPLPLGGTSNHFKREALVRCHGWDPCNVTEDADLGIRLARYGLHSAVTASLTRETAPRALSVWMPQRARWLKGWMVTWLVHGRRPFSLVRDIGLRRALLVHGNAFSQVAAPIAHPLGLVALGLHTTGARPLPEFSGGLGSIFLGILVFAVVIGHGTSLLIARNAVRIIGRDDLLPWTWAMPVHWLLVGLAAWRAAFGLVTHPRRWAKTPHEPDASPPLSDQAS